MIFTRQQLHRHTTTLTFESLTNKTKAVYATRKPTQTYETALFSPERTALGLRISRSTAFCSTHRSPWHAHVTVHKRGKRRNTRKLNKKQKKGKSKQKNEKLHSVKHLFISTARSDVHLSGVNVEENTLAKCITHGTGKTEKTAGLETKTEKMHSKNW